MAKLLDPFWSLPSCSNSFGNYVQTLTLLLDVIKLLYGLSFMSSPQNLPLLLSRSPGSYSEFSFNQNQIRTIPIKSAWMFSIPFSLTCPFIEQLFWINEIISLHENWHSLKMVWIYHHNPERHLRDNWSYLTTARKKKKAIYQLF